jgi:hypothetical protein
LANQSVTTDIPPELAAHPHWQLVQRIVASPVLLRSHRLCTFLLYVTRCALLEHSDHVTEQQIGVHVFGRPPDYNASEDNIVRSHARFLRAKLAEYFASGAGLEEPVVLTIPKGTYLPQFQRREEAPPAPRPGPRPGRQFWIPAAIVALCLLAGLALMLRREPARTPATAFENPVWSAIFDGRQPTTFVASDYIYSMVQEAAGRPLSLDEYLSPDYLRRAHEFDTASGLERIFPSLEQRHYTGFENVTALKRLSAIKAAQSTRLAVRFARDLTMRDIEAGNVILIGSRQSNPWVYLFEPKMDFRFVYQPASHQIFVENRAPRPGEEAVYRPGPLESPSRDTYGGIALVPNLHRGSSVLLVQGTAMAASEVALEMVDNPALFRELMRCLGSGKSASGLPYFEALIRTRTVNGVSGETSVIACRQPVE